MAKEAPSMRVYLAGTIDNTELIECIGWRVEMSDRLSPFGIATIDPTQTILPLPDSTPNRQDFAVPAKAIVERDLMDINRSDLMVVCFPAKTKKFSIGSIMEMVYAKQAGIPVLMVDLTKDKRYRNHPWTQAHYTMAYDDIEQVIEGVLGYWRVK